MTTKIIKLKDYNPKKYNAKKEEQFEKKNEIERFSEKKHNKKCNNTKQRPIQNEKGQ